MRNLPTPSGSWLLTYKMGLAKGFASQGNGREDSVTPCGELSARCLPHSRCFRNVPRPSGPRGRSAAMAAQPTWTDGGPWANGREVESHANSCSAEHLPGGVTVVWLSYTYTVHYCHQAVIVLTNNGKQSVSYRPRRFCSKYTCLGLI